MKKLLSLLVLATSLGTSAMAQTSCQAYFYANTFGCPQILFNDYSYVDSAGGDFVTSWYWNFGDGGTSTSMNPTYTYAANGTYVVCLTIGTQLGCQSNFCDSIDINCIGGSGGSCQAAFYQDSGWNCPTINLYNASTSTSGIMSYYYNFGDGSSSTSANPTHTYTANGLYTVCLTIISQDSCTDTYCEAVQIGCLGSQSGCQAYFYQDSTACPTVSLIDGSIGSGAISSYYYDFGDGSSSTSMDPIHTYTSNGTYTICLTIVADSNCTDTYCQTIQIGCIAGLEEAVLENSFVSPNPAQNLLTLNLGQPLDIRFRIYGMNGSVYASGERSASNVHRFEVDNLAQGIYLLEIETEGAREVLRFIKE